MRERVLTMKKVIKGLIYNTENSTEIGRFNNGLDREDYQFWEASLYTSPHKKHYFLAGFGGPMTRFGVINDSSSGWCGAFSERLDRMSKEKAFEWARIYLSPEVVEEYFSDMM